jgi:microcompartment protein CcmK/EutM
VFVAKVIGTVVSDWKEENLRGHKLLVVQDLQDLGTKKTVIAVDGIGANVDDTVLVVYEGGSARQTIGSEDAPINAGILGIVESADNYI